MDKKTLKAGPNGTTSARTKKLQQAKKVTQQLLHSLAYIQMIPCKNSLTKKDKKW